MHHRLSTKHLFAESGEIAELMRSPDWSQMAMGSISIWPPTLRTALGILFDASTPMICVWGSDRTLFYNDACLHLLLKGSYGLSAEPSLTCGLSEAWEDILTAIEAVFATGQPIQVPPSVDLESGRSAKLPITWSYSIVWDEAGQIGGVFATGANAISEVPIQSPPVQAETVLEENEAKFYGIANSSPIMIWMSAPDGAGTWFNQRWCEFTGQTLEEALGQGWLTAVHPADTSQINQQCSQAHQKHEPVYLEYRLRRHDGVYRWVLDSAVPWFDDDGFYQGYIGSIIDISDRKQAEAALQESEALKQSILDSSNDCIKVLSLEGQILYVNQGGLSMLEVDDPNTVLDTCWVDLWQGEDHERAKAVLTLARADQVGHMQGYCPTSSGKPKWWDVVATPLRDASGQITKLVMISRDITDRVQAEKALQLSEERYRLLNSTLSSIVWTTDARGAFVIPQSEWELYTGQTWTEYQGWGWIKALHPSDRRRILAQWQQAQERGAVSVAEGRLWHAASHEYRYFEARGMAIFNSDGSVREWVGNVTDVHDRKQAEAALRESEERFRDLADNISQFAWMAEADGWIFWYNQRWFDYTGTTLEDMQGWGWHQVHHPDHVERVVEKISHCFSTGEIWEDTFPLRDKDGKYSWFLSRAIPLRDEQGQVLRWFGTNTDITELRQAEMALKDATERLSIALKSAPITLFNQDRDLRYTWIHNPTHNYSIEQVISQRDEDLVSAEAAAHLRQLKQTVLETGVGLRKEVKVETTYYDLTIDPIQDGNNAIVGITCAAVDISQRARLEAERKQAQETLRQSEDRLRMAVESAQLGTWDWNLVTNELVWDVGCKAMFGLSPDAEIDFEIFLAALHPEDRDPVTQVIQMVLTPGSVGYYDIDYRVVGIEDGIERWISAKGQAYFRADGTPQRFTGTVLDISDRKHFERALMESEAIAVARAEELSALMETTPAAIWIAHDPHCYQMTANQTAYELMGTQPGSLTTATPADGSAPLPFKQFQDGQELLPQDLPIQKAIRTRQEVTNEIEFVFPDGSVRYIYGKAVPLYSPSGVVRGAIAGFVEITALKESEREREQLLQRERLAREEAEQANRLKDQFLAVLSHELRSPLNPILGWSKLLQTRKFDEAKTAQALATIERNAQLQAQLVDDLLDLAKILRGKLHLNNTPVNLAFVIEAAMEAVKTTAAAKSIALHLDLDAHTQVLGDVARLQQIVWNLLSNAIKFTPEHGQVEIKLRQIDAQAQITVKDTGIGISSDFLPYIFESFRQEDISITRKHGGLGLGLAIVRQLVEAHGGTITAASPGEGMGATFTVQLPELNAELNNKSIAVIPKRELDLTGIQILAVDDSADTREFLKILLEQCRAIVTVVSSAPEVLAKLEEVRPDVLISDIGMPEMDGYSLIRQIRALPPERGGQIPAIALTAYAQEKDQQQALASGYQQHLAKPLDIEKLVQAVITLTHP